MTPEGANRLRRMPRVRRARGFRLYTDDGRRIIDLWQGGGCAILGHRGGKLVTRLKAVLDRGVLVPFPSAAEHRLALAVGRLFAGFPPFRVAVFSSEARAIEALSRATGRVPEACLPLEPVTAAVARNPAGSSATAVSYWRPFLPAYDGAAHLTAGGAVLPVLPAGMLSDAQVVVYPSDGVELVSDLISEPVLTILATAAHALCSAPAPSAAHVAGFASAGPYLVPMAVVGVSAPSDYDTIFGRVLDAGVLLSPEPSVPSIYPGELSDGERRL
ncbi:MAG: hypothetical protein ACOC7V_16500, partial [Spirochaetota bacterium]